MFGLVVAAAAVSPEMRPREAAAKKKNNITRARRGGRSLCKEHALQPSVNRSGSCGPDRLRCGTAGEGGGQVGRKGASVAAAWGGSCLAMMGWMGKIQADCIFGAVENKSFFMEIIASNDADRNQPKLVQLCQD